MRARLRRSDNSARSCSGAPSLLKCGFARQSSIVVSGRGDHHDPKPFLSGGISTGVISSLAFQPRLLAAFEAEEQKDPVLHD
jgi:hypothetical protein